MNKDNLTQKTIDYHGDLISSLKDPEEAYGYLHAALEEYQEDNNKEALLSALKNVTKAQGGIAKLARNANLNRQNLYKIFSDKGNPKLDNFGAILKGLGFKLSIEPFDRQN